MALGVLAIAALLAVLVIAAIVGIITYVASRGRPAPWQAPSQPGEHTVIALRISGGTADDPAVQRLVRDAAARQFATHPQVQSVEVRRSDGVVLDTVRREERLRPAPDIPDDLRVGRAPRRHGPSVTGSGGGGIPAMNIDPADFATSDKPFSDQFALPVSVRERISDLNSPTALVAAILDEAGVAYEAQPGIVVADGTAIVLVGDGSGHTVTSDELARAFLRFESARTSDGVAVCLGYVNPQELRRRELLAPTLRHAGPEAIQRMADALHLGGNPVHFAAGPGLV